MAYCRRLGPVPQQRHTLFKDAEGNVLHEELMGEEGFSPDSSLLYHRHIPSALVGARTSELPDQSLTSNDPLLPRHLKLHELFAEERADEVDAAIRAPAGARQRRRPDLLRPRRGDLAAVQERHR